MTTKKSRQPERTSIYRGVWWDPRKKRFRAEIEVGGQRHKLGWWHDDRDAARAYDLACEQFDVPERRNFGAHKLYDDLTLLRARMKLCRVCKGVGMIGGEFNLKNGPGGHSRFIKLGQWRECENCRGAGYLIGGEPVELTDLISEGVGFCSQTWSRKRRPKYFRITF
jgi:hypothetical protein